MTQSTPASTNGSARSVSHPEFSPSSQDELTRPPAPTRFKKLLTQGENLAGDGILDDPPCVNDLLHDVVGRHLYLLAANNHHLTFERSPN